MDIKILKQNIVNVTNSSSAYNDKLQTICDLLKQNVSYYDWVGFYFKNGNKNELKLAQFAGKPTEHTIIPFGKGICGQVAVSNKNFVVQDVTEQDNYISCGFKVKSEIVIPIFVNDENIGQIDIDSHSVHPFTKKDEELLEFVCDNVGKLLTLNKKMDSSITTLFVRDLERLINEIEAYTSDAALWKTEGDIKNSSGNLALHLMGNLNHFIGAALGNTKYKRDREKEFSSKGASRKQILEQIENTKIMIQKVVPNLAPNDLQKIYPLSIRKEGMVTSQFLIYLYGHFSYHLGQINYHRRLLDKC